MTSAALVAAALGGCASSPSGPDITFDACEPLGVVPPANASADQLASLSDAIALWHADGVAGLAIGGGGSSSVALVFKDAPDVFYGYYDAPNATVYVNQRVTDRAERAVVIAHELGHAFGLVHVPPAEHASVMNPGNLTVAPNAADRTALAAMWGACPRP